jgi:uncharacterized protein HemY
MFLEKSRIWLMAILCLALVLGTAFALNQHGVVGQPPYNATYHPEDLPAIVIDGVGQIATVALPFAPLIALVLLIILI